MFYAIVHRNDETIRRILSSDVESFFCCPLRETRNTEEEEEEETEEELPLWQSSNTLWNELLLQFGREETPRLFENIPHKDILYHAIGNVSIEHFQFIMDSITTTDNSEVSNATLCVAIKKACKKLHETTDHQPSFSLKLRTKSWC